MGYRLREPRKGKVWIYWLTFIIAAVPSMLWAEEGDTWIVFDCNRKNPNSTEYTTGWDIWKLDPDGNGSQSNDSLFGLPLTTATSNEWDPTYSSEDKSVVFISDKDGWPHLYKMSINGGAWRQLTQGEYSDADPCYNFQGNKIAFTSNRNGTWQIYVMSVDGQDPIHIKQDYYSDNRSPCFSKSGGKVYFLSNSDKSANGFWEIYYANSDGKGDAPKKAIAKSDGTPWLLDFTELDPCCSSSDSNIIVFASNYTHTCYSPPFTAVNRINFELFKFDFNNPNSAPVLLTESWNAYLNSKNQEVRQLWSSSMPCFSPDGNKIAWSADHWTSKSVFLEGHGWKWSACGSTHEIWIRNTTDSASNNSGWKAPTKWRWVGGLSIFNENGSPFPDMHYNPSWDSQP